MYSKQYYLDNHEHIRAYFKQYRNNNKERFREIRRKSFAKKRLELFNVLGGAICSRCGFSDIRALQLDHINGGGCRTFRDAKCGLFSVYKKYISNPELAKKELQVLCANCNWIKRHENNEFTSNLVT